MVEGKAERTEDCGVGSLGQKATMVIALDWSMNWNRRILLLIRTVYSVIVSLLRVLYKNHGPGIFSIVFPPGI